SPEANPTAEESSSAAHTLPRDTPMSINAGIVSSLDFGDSEASTPDALPSERTERRDSRHCLLSPDAGVLESRLGHTHGLEEVPAVEDHRLLHERTKPLEIRSPIRLPLRQDQERIDSF